MSAHKRRRSSSSEGGRVPVWSAWKEAELSARHAIVTDPPSANVTTVKPTAIPSTSPRSIPPKIPYVPLVSPLTYPQRIVLPDHLPDYKPSGNGKALTWYWNKVPSEVSAHLIAYNLITGEDIRVEDLHLPKPVADLTRQEALTALATYMNETSRHIEYPITYPRIRASPNKWGKAWPESSAKRRKLNTAASTPSVDDCAAKPTPTAPTSASHEPRPRKSPGTTKFPIRIEWPEPKTAKARRWSWHQSKDSIYFTAVNDLTSEDVRIEDLVPPQFLAKLPRKDFGRILISYMEETSGETEVVGLMFPRVWASRSAWGQAWRERMASEHADRTMSLPIRQFK